MFCISSIVALSYTGGVSIQSLYSSGFLFRLFSFSWSRSACIWLVLSFVYLKSTLPSPSQFDIPGLISRYVLPWVIVRTEILLSNLLWCQPQDKIKSHLISVLPSNSNHTWLTPWLYPTISSTHVVPKLPIRVFLFWFLCSWDSIPLCSISVWAFGISISYLCILSSFFSRQPGIHQLISLFFIYFRKSTVSSRSSAYFMTCSQRKSIIVS